MGWNWQKGDWPRFRWDKAALDAAETMFLHQSGVLIGATMHFSENEEKLLVVDLITGEAMKTSEIEGEYLNRDNVQSSIRRNFGLDTDSRRIEPAERGISDMMSDLFNNFDRPLNHASLFQWHQMLTIGRRDLEDIGRYRTHDEPMRIVSGRIDKPTVHFQAPLSNVLIKEMDRFMAWWHGTAPGSRKPLQALTRAGMAHLYFVCIHPFEDGNGRIGRALAEKALAECLGKPTLIALSQTIARNRKAYYNALEESNKDNEITEWLAYFAKTILEAQAYSMDMIDFLIEKTKLYDRVSGHLNGRQIKVMERMFREGLEGFMGGLSAQNYVSLTTTSRATATRDLLDLVEKGALLKTGELKGTRYHLNIKRRRKTKLGH